MKPNEIGFLLSWGIFLFADSTFDLFFLIYDIVYIKRNIVITIIRNSWDLILYTADTAEKFVLLEVYYVTLRILRDKKIRGKRYTTI